MIDSGGSWRFPLQGGIDGFHRRIATDDGQLAQHDLLLPGAEPSPLAGKSVDEIRTLYAEQFRGGMYGLCFSAYGEGQSAGDQLQASAVGRRIELIVPHTRWVRCFACTEGHEVIPRLARAKGLKTMVGALDPVTGAVRAGSGLSLGYFTQDAIQFDGEDTPLDYMVWECGLDVGPARDVLAKFLFTGDDVFKPISAVSGGERNKLQLAWTWTAARPWPTC